jgi:ABC-2 type transport system ATP-binding protein
MRALVLATLFLLAAAAPASARDVVVKSFDGTEIHATFHLAEGLKANRTAPTILMTHGWAGSRQKDPNGASSEAVGGVGVGPLRKAGFNVLTWDSRGFGESGGTVTVDWKQNEGRDVVALLNWLADQPEATLDGPNDPRVGMHGPSYAGGIELVAAGIDDRIDAIAPSIAWNSLLTSLYKAETVKGGWASVLFASGNATGRLDPHIQSAYLSGATTGTLSAEDRAWFESRGPGDALVRKIRAPTLLVQGTADTLFTTSEAIRNYGILRRNHVPVKMLWFCGGHGTCLTGSGPAGHFEQAVITWLRKYVAMRLSLKTGPGFEWLADDAVWRSSPSWPPQRGTPIVANGSGTLAVNPADAASGQPTAAGPAANAVNVPIPAATAQVVGEPRLRLTYSGTGTATHVFAQIVDEKRNVVLGNQVTPLPITLDGASHTITRSLEGVAASMTPAGRYHLQITGGSLVYGPVRGLGAITIAGAHLELPTVGTPKGCHSANRFSIALPRMRTGKAWVGGKRTKVKRSGGRLRAVVDLRQKAGKRVRVRAVGRTKRGNRVRSSRTFRVCD